MAYEPEIPVLLSRSTLDGAALPLSGPEPAGTLPLKDWGVTYSMAQETRWIDEDSFAIGRWDGTLTLFRMPAGPEGSPTIESAAVCPAWVGLQMITPIDATLFATSNDRASVTIWQLQVGEVTQVRPCARLAYDSAHGVANSGAYLDGGGSPRLVTGHSEGVLLVWKPVPDERRFEVERAIDVRSPNPVRSPHRLWNVRNVVPWRGSVVITGSEDGDLCLVDVTSGEIRFRMRYSPVAQRGINDVARLDDLLLVGCCSVGREDRNTWLYRVEDDRIVPLASTDLVRDETRSQVFNFSVELVRSGDAVYFFGATEEGLLWMGSFDGTALNVLGSKAVSTSIGAAISAQHATNMLAVVGDNVHLYQVT